MAQLSGAEAPDEHPGAGLVDHWVEESGATVIKLVGELDLANIGIVRAAVGQVLDQGPDRLVFDLAELSFMDSSGIAVMLDAARRTGSVVLRHPMPVIRRVVERTGLAEILVLEP